ncbi:MAG: hypothetical protein WA085_15000 [Sphingobium sp.]|uniref:hypothetical protein n=1 Tax=Sphingobium sp. CECT 9361 TaxID=2845384 RepID=UPI001E512EC9|nr:hypothetical protein [Sphingobium sp. CECT 9361]
MANLPRARPIPKYERRLLLFIDFLGFKEVVASTERDPDGLQRLLAAMDDIGTLGEASIFKSQRVTQFSDSVVMSYRVTERSGVFWMINAIALTVISLAERGFLLRGAVTVGDLYHNSRHIVGPAMVKAYEMESKVACHPRVIVDPAVIRLARKRRNEDHTPNEEEAFVRDFMAEDADGHLFIDYISWNAVVAVAGADDYGYPDYLGTLSGLLRNGLAHEDVRVVAKFLWLLPRYMDAVERFAAIPEDAPYRLENPENCGFIESLPRFEDLAVAARARISEASKGKGC